MKNLNLLSVYMLSIIGLVGCSDDNPLKRENLIEFNETDITKSDVEEKDEINEFSVWGEYKVEDGKEPINVFENERVYKGSNNAWTYEGSRYWNIGSYDFYAIHPITSSKSYNLAFDGKMPSEIKDVKLSNDTERLMFAMQHKTYPFSSGESHYVSLRFRHLMSMIGIKVKTPENMDYQITLKSVSLYNLPVEGNCKIKKETNDWSCTWSFTSNRTDVNNPSYYVEENKEIGTEYTPVLEPNMVFPQKFTSDNPLGIAFKYKTSKGKELFVKKELKNLELESGQKYYLSITIGALDNIIIDQIEVDEWNSALVGSVIVPL